eukprot:TRINITY_DN15443_c0_g1_i1.p1 TRINITY_DN15443_c0_g1~~TRINITY_DN15443_c0_g1_i1.p1  ORF type:complete len:196 (-),score=31.30 TRINITY_DN15443_c0_g1_i1:34-621(-)
MKDFNWEKLRSKDIFSQAYDQEINPYASSLSSCKDNITKALECMRRTRDKNKCEKSIGELSFCLCNNTHKGDPIFKNTIDCLNKKENCQHEVRELRDLVISDYFKRVQRISKNMIQKELDTFICENEKTLDDKMICQSQIACTKNIDFYSACLSKSKKGEDGCLKEGKELMKCLGNLNNKLIFVSVTLLFENLVK